MPPARPTYWSSFGPPYTRRGVGLSQPTPTASTITYVRIHILAPGGVVFFLFYHSPMNIHFFPSPESCEATGSNVRYSRGVVRLFWPTVYIVRPKIVSICPTLKNWPIFRFGVANTDGSDQISGSQQQFGRSIGSLVLGCLLVWPLKLETAPVEKRIFEWSISRRMKYDSFREAHGRRRRFAGGVK